ncbi:GDSL family lipase [Clostridium sp. Sa3CUN1]|uniref:GDSL family lipase n=1 Tax=Clostridium gallinarum TaxID=2762246 RepID=A0ABR8Q488_9CLOT|nr:GDSL-type esterase/lipase family protein [Clostridium gallinarum]MBD7915144.1 GDSL family lipase [Clostridium gallinarum]
MNNNFVLIGDSLTFGYGVSKSNSWVEGLKNYIISKNINYTIFNKGINGNTTTDMLNRFTEDVINLNPNKIFIMGGTNDLLSNRQVSSIVDNIELMIKESLSKTNDIIIGIPPRIIKEDAKRLFMPSLTYDYCEKNLENLKVALINLCNNYNVKFIDFYSLTLNNNIYIDGIHFNNEGHKIFLEEFIRKIFPN